MPRLLIVANEAAMMRDFLNPYARHFRAKGWTVDAMACDALESDDCRGVYDHLFNVAWSRDPLAFGTWRESAARVRSIVKSNRYDIVHVHTPIPAFLTRLALRQMHSAGGPRIVYTAHGFHFHPRGGRVPNLLFRGLETLAARWTDFLIVINRTDETAALEHHLIAPERLAYMPGIGIDLQQFHPRSVTAEAVARVRADLYLQDDQALITMLAEFTPNKRHGDVVEAFARMNHPSAHLAFAGYGPTLEAVRRQALECGVAHRITFLGFRRDVPALLRASAMLVLPSQREGLPRSVMEALALEVPVVGSDIRGIRDLLSDRAGLLVPFANTRQLSEAMSWVLENPDHARVMARTGRERLAGYDLNRLLAEHERLYAGLLRERVETAELKRT